MNERTLILVVEDNEANQMLARAVLELEGYAVEVVGSAPEAAEWLSEKRPDLVLMDIQLPGQDGLSFTRELKQRPETRDIPVVALTAHAMHGDRELTISAGCLGYIAKPIDTRTFGASVGHFLRLAGSDQGHVVARQ